MKVRISVNGKILTATLADNETTRDFVSLLPLTPSMDDLFRREKFARLPRAISTGGKPQYTYQIGDLALWSPGPDLAIYYRDDGQRIPRPGIIVVGRIDSGAEALDAPGKANVTIELMK